tara:strand:- start:160 stop:393 length:234 start_codon:yes stop_codon:yes gene_type:complete
MKTLYDKLKPEYKQKLKEEAADYPSLVGSVVESLKDNYIWSHLTIGQAKDFIQFTDKSYGALSSYDWSFGEAFFDNA